MLISCQSNDSFIVLLAIGLYLMHTHAVLQYWVRALFKDEVNLVQCEQKDKCGNNSRSGRNTVYMYA